MYLYVLERANRIGIEALARPEKAVVCTVLLEAEVNNGGFDQYFFNSAGDWARQTLVALTDIGAFHTVELFSKAVAAFPGGMPSAERQLRWRELDEVDQATLSRLDAEFYKERDNLTELLYAHIRANARAFTAVASDVTG